MEIKLDNISCPLNWGEVTIKQFISYQELLENNKITERDYIKQCLSNFLNISFDIVNLFPDNNLVELWSKLKWIETVELKKTDVIEDVEIGGVTYTLTNEDYLTLIEYSEATDIKEIDKNIDVFCAILLRPLTTDNKIEEYNNETVYDRAKIFREGLDIVTALSIVDFFLLMLKDFSYDSEDFLNKTMEIMIGLAKSGEDGLVQSGTLQSEELLERLNKFGKDISQKS